MINISICEDEKTMITLIEQYVNSIMNGYEVQYKVSKYDSGKNLLNGNLKDIDILLLDIQMEKLNGMEVAYEIRKIGLDLEIIFITSLMDYVKEGYKVNAFRYLTKPINIDELKENLIKCVEKVKNEKKNYIKIVNKFQTSIVYIKDIKYVEIQKRHLIIHTIKKDIDIVCTMDKIKKDINSNKFIYSHSSFLININFVESVKKDKVILRNGEELPISKHRYKKFRDAFLKMLGEEVCC